jgi:hypothetical protein
MERVAQLNFHVLSSYNNNNNGQKKFIETRRLPRASLRKKRMPKLQTGFCINTAVELSLGVRLLEGRHLSTQTKGSLTLLKEKRRRRKEKNLFSHTVQDSTISLSFVQRHTYIFLPWRPR